MKAVYILQLFQLSNVMKMTIPLSGTPSIVAIEAVHIGIMSSVWEGSGLSEESRSSKLNEAKRSSGIGALNKCLIRDRKKYFLDTLKFH